MANTSSVEKMLQGYVNSVVDTYDGLALTPLLKLAIENVADELLDGVLPLVVLEDRMEWVTGQHRLEWNDKGEANLVVQWLLHRANVGT